MRGSSARLAASRKSGGGLYVDEGANVEAQVEIEVEVSWRGGFESGLECASRRRACEGTLGRTGLRDKTNHLSTGLQSAHQDSRRD